MNTENEIIKKFQNAQDSLVIQSSDLSLESIASMVESEAIDIAPHYQRRDRWSPEKQSALIESFLLNIPVPPIYLAEDEYGTYSVIDGKQRITAIYNFIKKSQKLKSLDDFQDLEGLTFKELPSPLNNALRIRPYIRVVTLLKQSDPALKYEVFTRLNTGGESLTPQEVRKAAYPGKLIDLVYELAETPFLKQQLKITGPKSTAYKKMLDAEYVLRFFALRDSWEAFPGNMNKAMDTFMGSNHKCQDDQLGDFRDLFTETMEVCAVIWGDNAFMKPENGTYRKLMLQGMYDAQMVPVSFYVKEYKDKIIQKKNEIREQFVAAYDNELDDFQNSIRQFTSNPQRVVYRIARVQAILKSVLDI